MDFAAIHSRLKKPKLMAGSGARSDLVQVVDLIFARGSQRGNRIPVGSGPAPQIPTVPTVRKIGVVG